MHANTTTNGHDTKRVMHKTELRRQHVLAHYSAGGLSPKQSAEILGVALSTIYDDMKALGLSPRFGSYDDRLARYLASETPEQRAARIESIRRALKIRRKKLAALRSARAALAEKRAAARMDDQMRAAEKAPFRDIPNRVGFWARLKAVFTG